MTATIFEAWGAFVNGKLYIQRPDPGTYDEPRYAIFPTRKAASRAYADVRRIEVTVKEIQS